MRFFLGVPEPSWLARLDVELCVSHNRLSRRTRRSPFPRALRPWALDSGAFTRLNNPPHRFLETPGEYAQAVRRYADEVGQLAWAAPQDWMCEPEVRAKTRLTIEDHQRLTIDSYEDLVDEGVPVIPVLQGWTVADYVRHAEVYAVRGHRLEDAPVVGVGSICRRQATGIAPELLGVLQGGGLRLHGFGLKKTTLARCSHLLASADSQAWSMRGRRRGTVEEGCTHAACNNCPRWAMRWRSEVLAEVERPEQTWFSV